MVKRRPVAWRTLLPGGAHVKDVTLQDYKARMLRVLVLIRAETTEWGIKLIVQSAGIVSGKNEEGYQFFEIDPDPEAQDATEFVDEALSMIRLEQDEAAFGLPICLTSNAITIAGKPPIQIIVRFTGTPAQVFNNFDFEHCKM